MEGFAGGNPAADDIFGNGDLEGVLSQSDDDDFEPADSDVESSEADYEEGDFSEDPDISGDEIPDDIELNGAEKPNGDSNDQPNYKIVTDANGDVRYEYEEIDPANTIGDIPLSFYDSYPHIGYTLDGKKIMRPAAGDALDSLLDSIEVPKDWTGLTDPATGKPLRISKEELEILKRIQLNEIPEDGYDPYPDLVEYFTSIEEKMPLSSAPEPKRRFVPSKHEAKRVAKMVRLIREGKLLPYKPPEENEREEEEKEEAWYDVWANEEAQEPHVMHIPAPKLPPPQHDLSVNPPEEYLPSAEERKAWDEQESEDRTKEYLPTKYDSLRKVPAYMDFTKERFERCLDLVSVSPTGDWVASGGDDGTVCVWDLNGHLEYRVKLSSDEPVDVVRWRPTKDTLIIAAAAGDDVFMIVPDIGVDSVLDNSRDVLDAGFGYATNGKQMTGGMTADGQRKDPPAKWARPGSRLEAQGVLLKATLRSTVKVLSWHRRGDFFCTVSPNGQRGAIAIHTLSKHLTQIPFRRLRGLPQTAHFHPSRPLFFVATRQAIRCYDLQQQQLVKILQPGARHISSFDIHPGGDNVVVGSYDRRLLWHDMDLSARPYKTMRFHPRAIRAVKFHKGGFPLFADASDDGTLQIFHGKVVSDLMENATIVPVKMLKGHEVVASLGVLDVDWHTAHPWCVSAGADSTCKLWC
ncbi:unnamed protein product [Parascedosporium putredinis]|uniref:Ribosome biogenesis protein ERB1 n=1 Tax=Parascedosporium putredinis TaxID=1442378 RepID=A0A9P1H841_9PEZI|nr:unnamed protein product [Parascedosporium putredinis]CAI7999026.1 unnamed protein product [Parascedosporium putredinis]